MKRRREIDAEEVGSRSFEVQRSRAVETAIAHLRHGLGSGWDLYLPGELKTIQWILAEAWTVIGPRGWEQIGFSYATREQVCEIIAVGERAQSGQVVRLSAARRVASLLNALPRPGEVPPGGADTSPTA